MDVNSSNIRSGVVWNENTAVNAQKITDFSNMPKPANADKFVLNPPVSETVYKRQEFVNDERTGENCACCYTYMERTLVFADGFTISGRSETSYFAINLDSAPRDFSKSGADMNGISRAVEETWEYKERSMAQASVSGAINGSVGFAAQSTAYKYSSVSKTVGSVSYKDGAKGVYAENTMVSRELYNKCAVILAGAFGEDGSELTLSEKAFDELFGKPDENAAPDKLSQRLETLEKQRKILKDFMDKHLNDVRKKEPESRGLKAFNDAYSLLGDYSYNDISKLIEKLFAIK